MQYLKRNLPRTKEENPNQPRSISFRQKPRRENQINKNSGGRASGSGTVLIPEAPGSMMYLLPGTLD